METRHVHRTSCPASSRVISLMLLIGSMSLARPGDTQAAGTVAPVSPSAGHRSDRWVELATPTWHYFPTTHAIAQDPISPLTLYAATDNGIYRTTDGAAHWVVSKEEASYCLAINPLATRIVFAGQDGVYRSLDHGHTWSKVLRAEYGDAIAVDPQNPRVVYAGVRSWNWEDLIGRFMKSTDGGESWSLLGEPIWYWAIYSIAVKPDDSETVLRGTNTGLQRTGDGGLTWTTVLGGVIHSVAFDPLRCEIAYAGTYDRGVYKSTDGGDSWDPVNSGLPDPSLLDECYVAVDPRNTARLFLGTVEGVFESLDGGLNWREISGPLPERSIKSLIPDLLSAEGTLFVGSTGGATVYGSRGGGIFRNEREGWVLRSKGIREQSCEETVETIAVDPSRSNIIYAEGYVRTVEVWDPTNSMLFKSTDSGRSWSVLDLGWDGECGNAIAIHPFSPETIYVADAAGVRVSHDGGHSLALSNLTYATASLAIDPTDTRVLYAGVDDYWDDKGGIYKSTNGGWDWGPINNGIPGPWARFEAILVDPGDPQTVYASANGFYGVCGIYKSTDGGDSWTQVESTFEIESNCFCQDPLHVGTLYAGVDKRVWKTTDGGLGWEAVYACSTWVCDVTSVVLDPVDPSTLYVAVNGIGFLKSKDFGRTWTEMNEGLQALPIAGSFTAICPSDRNRVVSAERDGRQKVVAFERSADLTLDPDTTVVRPGQRLGVGATLTNFLNAHLRGLVGVDVYLNSHRVHHSERPVRLTPYQVVEERFEFTIPSGVEPGDILEVVANLGPTPDHLVDWDRFGLTVVP